MKYNNPRVKLFKKISTYKETFVNKMKKVKKNTIKKGVNDEYKPSHEPIKPTKQIEALKRFIWFRIFNIILRKSLGAIKQVSTREYFNTIEYDLKVSSSK